MAYSLVDTMSQAYVNIKGTSDGLIVYMGAGEWNTLVAALADRLEQTPSFFRGGRVALHVGPRQLTRRQLESTGELLSRYQISLWAVLSDSEQTQEVAAELGLEVVLSPSIAARLDVRPAKQEDQDIEQDRSAILVKRILRSGQKVHNDGHVVLIGDVNPGAEVVATGDVIVWGRLRGTAHAGASGNDQAVICALSLSPMLLRIGHYMARSPGNEADERPYEQPVVPEMAFVHNGQIVAEPWRESESMFGDWRADLLRRASNTLSTWF